ncbi:MAG: M48 family metallopeptidase [Bdellovibrionales bacterium]|jgi:predicted metal-dependent hydrolase|nr:M48 family metallopeptidase [Bdellovibrionales bacterium]
MEILKFQNLEVVVERAAFQQGYSLFMHPDRPMRIKVGYMDSQNEILAFLNLKRKWIEKHHSNFARLTKDVKRPLMAQQEFPFRGALYRLKPVITLNSDYFFSQTDSELLLHVPRERWSAEVFTSEFQFLHPKLREFYKRASLVFLKSRVDLFSKQMDLFPKLLRWTEPKTRWGSCSARGSIQLNWRMIVFSDEIIDYVVIHELLHLRHFNHSKAFWEAVGCLVPNYKEVRKALKVQQLLPNFLNLSLPVEPSRSDRPTRAGIEKKRN